MADMLTAHGVRLKSKVVFNRRQISGVIYRNLAQLPQSTLPSCFVVRPGVFESCVKNPYLCVLTQSRSAAEAATKALRLN
jgi:hypothetical protein